MFFAFKKWTTVRISHAGGILYFLKHYKHTARCVNTVRMSANCVCASPQNQQTRHACAPSWPQRYSGNIRKRNLLSGYPTYITYLLWKKYRKFYCEEAFTRMIRSLVLNMGEFIAHRIYRWLLETISLDLIALHSRQLSGRHNHAFDRIYSLGH